MNLLGMGPGELILIAMLGLIIFGPGKLPEIAGQVGRMVRDFRRSTSDIQSEFQRSFSLDEPVPVAAVGPAAVYAQNGSASAENGAVAALEAPVAATSQWSWEAGPTADEPAQPPAFWDWEPAAPAVEPTLATAESEPAPAEAVGGASLWQWDEPAPAAAAAAPVPPPVVPGVQ